MLIAWPTQLLHQKVKTSAHLWMMTSLHFYIWGVCWPFVLWACKNWPFWVCWYSVTIRMVAKLAQITTHNTTQNTTTNMGCCRCCPTLQWLSSLSPLVWQRRPQILALCLSHECARGASRRVCAHHFSSPCLGHPNATHPIIERGGVPWPWPPF